MALIGIDHIYKCNASLSLPLAAFLSISYADISCEQPFKQKAKHFFPSSNLFRKLQSFQQKGNVNN